MGLAAIQLARGQGAEVFATASAAKQGYLRSLGVRHVYDSRSTNFARRVLAETGGAGVDVVLNSLTGEGFIPATLSALAPGWPLRGARQAGRRPAEQMSRVRPDVAYHVLAIDQLLGESPGVVVATLSELVARVADWSGPCGGRSCRWPKARRRSGT